MRKTVIDAFKEMHEYYDKGDCANALEGVGLDSYVGFMHTDKPGRKSLALESQMISKIR